jgi:hypothetical protein
MAAVLKTEEIGSHPRVATIPVWKRVYGDQAVVEPHGDFFQGKGRLSDLVADVVAHLLELDGYFSPRNSNAFVRSPKLPSPFPCPIEHPLMESLQAITTY